jgi:2'-5' RNA ligase
MRCFFGCPLPAHARALLVAAFAPLRRRLQGPGCNWVPEENIHLTLRFLGETDRGRLAAVTREAEAVFLGVQAPRLVLAGPGVFPPRGKRSLILWAGLQGDLEALARLARDLEEAARAAGFSPESRGFRPHVTLARIEARRAGALEGALLPALPAADCTPAAVHLFQSVFSGAEGPPSRSRRNGGGPVRYLTVASWPLRADKQDHPFHLPFSP